MKVFKILGLIGLLVFLFRCLQQNTIQKKVDPTELYEKATSHLNNEEYRKALESLENIPSLNQKMPMVGLYVFTQRKLKNYKKAEANYEKALELDPENKIALEYQGELFVETERLDWLK